MRKLTTEEIAAIQAAPSSETTSALAKRLGLKVNTVSYQRLVFARKAAKAHAFHPITKVIQESNIPVHSPEFNLTAMLASSSDGEAAPAVDHAPTVGALCRSRDTRPPSVATVCVSEPELDDWWAGLDVEAKADAFVEYSLRAQGQDDSHIMVSDSSPRIPVAGTIGETNETERK